jgi:hypothetical protein
MLKLLSFLACSVLAASDPSPSGIEEGTILNPDGTVSNRTILDFKTKFFWLAPKVQFSLVDVGLHSLSNINVDSNLAGLKIMANGFINNDLRSDLVTVN